MKKLATISVLIFLVGCVQPLTKTVGDAEKIKANENRFINKPLKILLKQVGPRIELVIGSPTQNPNWRLEYFFFAFIDKKKYFSYSSKNVYPKHIAVYIKEPFEWDFKRDASKWEDSDLKKYGDLTVLGIRVFGEVVN